MAYDQTNMNLVGKVADVGSNPTTNEDPKDKLSTMRSRFTTALSAYSESRED